MKPKTYSGNTTNAAAAKPSGDFNNKPNVWDAVEGHYLDLAEAVRSALQILSGETSEHVTGVSLTPAECSSRERLSKLRRFVRRSLLTAKRKTIFCQIISFAIAADRRGQYLLRLHNLPMKDADYHLTEIRDVAADMTFACDWLNAAVEWHDRDLY